MKKNITAVCIGAVITLAVAAYILYMIFGGALYEKKPTETFDRTPLDTASVFKDYVFERIVRQRFGLPEGDIDTSAFADVTSLDLSYSGTAETTDDKVLSLYGLRFFPSLTELIVDGNALASGLSGIEYCPLLTVLSVKNCRLYSADNISTLKNIVSLDFEGNEISSFMFLKEMHGLEYLNIGETNISSLRFLSFCDLTQLKTLYANTLDVDGISDIFEITSLEELDISGTSISSIDGIQALTGLKKIAASSNNITDISPLTSLPDITVVELARNSIADISPLATCEHLAELYISSNSVSSLYPLSGMTTLKRLDVSKNKISIFTALNTLELDYLNTEGNLAEYIK